MKRFFPVLIVAGLLFPATVWSHSLLQSSNPADGETVTSAPESIELTFNAGIEQAGSSIEVKNEDGNVQEVSATEVESSESGAVMTATFAEPLANGTYNVTWAVIGEDGHPTDGTFSFTVEVPEEADDTAGGEDEGTSSGNEPSDNSEQSASPESNEQGSSPNKQKTDNVMGTVLIVFAIVLALIVAAIFYFNRRR